MPDAKSDRAASQSNSGGDKNNAAQTAARSTSGLPLETVVTQESLAQDGWDPARDRGVPGEFPFTRGVYPTMSRGRLWTMRQYAGFGSAVESNRRFRYLLER